jgi:hypothetical protein
LVNPPVVRVSESIFSPLTDPDRSVFVFGLPCIKTFVSSISASS